MHVCDIRPVSYTHLDVYKRQALGKMQAQGQVSLDDLWSLSDNGVQALQILANKSGQSIEDMKKAISDGTVDANWARCV